MSNNSTNNININTEKFNKKLTDDIAEKRRLLPLYREEFLEAIANGETTHSFYVGRNLPLTISLMREFSEIFHVECDDDNNTVVVHFDKYSAEVVC